MNILIVKIILLIFFQYCTCGDFVSVRYANCSGCTASCSSTFYTNYKFPLIFTSNITKGTSAVCEDTNPSNCVNFQESAKRVFFKQDECFEDGGRWYKVHLEDGTTYRTMKVYLCSDGPTCNTCSEMTTPPECLSLYGFNDLQTSRCNRYYFECVADHTQRWNYIYLRATEYDSSTQWWPADMLDTNEWITMWDGDSDCTRVNSDNMVFGKTWRRYWQCPWEILKWTAFDTSDCEFSTNSIARCENGRIVVDQYDSTFNCGGSIIETDYVEKFIYGSTDSCSASQPKFVCVYGGAPPNYVEDTTPGGPGDTCDPICVNGDCNAGACSCWVHWGGTSCTTRICSPACVYGTCSQTVENQCDCQSGWQGDDCNEAICTAGCVNGNCDAPDTCTCNAGWGSAACDVPTCSACVHGTCTSPNVCTCLPGWSKFGEISDPFLAGLDCNTHECDPACQNGGVCNCTGTGFGGTYCQLSNCNCVHGTCGAGGADDCTCDTGYQGTLCDTPICTPNCENGGTCVAPNDCACPAGWTGYCNVAVCDPVCSHGVCDSPDSCTCMLGWSGDICEVVNCYGKAADDNQICSGHGQCIGPNVCECDDGWNGLMCNHKVVPGAVCFGIPSDDLTVCSARGSCVDTGFEGDMCEVEVICFGIPWDDPGQPPCAGNGICESTDHCRCYAGWKKDDIGACSVKDINTVLMMATIIPAVGVLSILCCLAIVALCILIVIKRQTLSAGGMKKVKKLQEELPPEEFDEYDPPTKKPPKRQNRLLNKTPPRRNRAPPPRAPPSRGKNNYNDDYQDDYYEDENYY